MGDKYNRWDTDVKLTIDLGAEKREASVFGYTAWKAYHTLRQRPP